jgi:hypothetical protein
MNQNRRNETRETISGILEILTVNLFLMFLFITIPIIGVVQLIYVIPRGFYLFNHQEKAKLKGFIIGAVITFLLNGGCWLAVMIPR